jgi:hypothetical protein
MWAAQPREVEVRAAGVAVQGQAQPDGAAVIQGRTLVPISAQLERTLPLSAQLKVTLSPT